MPKLIEVKIDSLRVSLTNQQRIVVLKQVDADRYLPIWIGPYEAESITIALQEIEVSRPQTHDLLTNLVKLLGGRITRVIINALRDDIFFGTLIIDREGEEIQVDSRPSDAIAVAVRAHVPIMVNPKVMEEAAIIPEEVSDSPEEEGEGEKETGGKEGTRTDSARVTLSDERLSIFEEYFKAKGASGDSQPDDDEQQDDNPPEDES